MRAALSTAAALLLAAAVTAQETGTGLPEPLQEVGFEQRLGAQVPLELVFSDHLGAPRRLEEFFGRRPVILAPVYYECPMLCTMILNGLTQALKVVSFGAGQEFNLLAVSFDPREGAAQAATSRAAFLARYGRPDPGDGWSFLTGDREAIARLTEAVGFRFRFNEASGEFAHTAGVVVLTPEGRVARYFFGIEYPPRDLRLALVEAADERIGSVVDRLYLYCFQYDPSTGEYSAVAMNMVRVGGVATLLVLGLFLTVSLSRERRARSLSGSAGQSPGRT